MLWNDEVSPDWTWRHKHDATLPCTYRPGVGELLPPLGVDLRAALPLEGGEADVEGGQTHRGEAGLVQEHLGQQVGGRVLGEQSRGQVEPVEHQGGVAESAIDHEPEDKSNLE